MPSPKVFKTRERRQGEHQSMPSIEACEKSNNSSTIYPSSTHRYVTRSPGLIWTHGPSTSTPKIRISLLARDSSVFTWARPPSSSALQLFRPSGRHHITYACCTIQLADWCSLKVQASPTNFLHHNKYHWQLLIFTGCTSYITATSWYYCVMDSC